MPEQTDETIAKEVQGGNVQAFGVLVERFEKSSYVTANASFLPTKKRKI